MRDCFSAERQRVGAAEPVMRPVYLDCCACHLPFQEVGRDAFHRV